MPKPDHLATVRAAWGDSAPDWIMILANACNEESTARIAAKISYSKAAVSRALHANYSDSPKMARAVVMALGGGRVSCPLLGIIPAADCQTNQQTNLNTSSRQGVRLYAACAACPENRSKKC